MADGPRVEANRQHGLAPNNLRRRVKSYPVLESELTLASHLKLGTTVLLALASGYFGAALSSEESKQLWISGGVLLVGVVWAGFAHYGLVKKIKQESSEVAAGVDVSARVEEIDPPGFPRRWFDEPRN